MKWGDRLKMPILWNVEDAPDAPKVDGLSDRHYRSSEWMG